jgi:hypothetical protein
MQDTNKSTGQQTMQALMLKPTEAARMAGVSARTITRMCEMQQVQAVKLRGAWRLNRHAFMVQLGITE